MRLDASEFTRRFLLHVLPSGFQRIRHYGLLANCHREAKLEHCRQLLQAPPPLPEEPLDYLDRYQRLTGLSLRDCPQCGQGQMVRIESFPPGTLPRGPPCVAS
jgi:Putative transposase